MFVSGPDALVSHSSRANKKVRQILWWGCWHYDIQVPSGPLQAMKTYWMPKALKMQ